MSLPVGLRQECAAAVRKIGTKERERLRDNK